MELASAAIGGVTNLFTGYASSILQFPTNVVNLKIKAHELKLTRDDVGRLIDAAQNNNQVIRTIVTDWQSKGYIVLDEASQLAIEVGRGRFSRMRLGRKVLEKIAEIQNLLDERIKFDILSDPKPFQSLEIVTDGNFEAFASREDTTKEVVLALQTDGVNLIGVFGMPGVGKTMLMQKIVKQAKEEKQFEEVVMVIVSQNPDVQKIQKEIAVQVDLTLSESSTIAAAQLNERLSRGKKILVALDDMWERLEFAKVGIPHKSNSKGCKVLFTTRRQDVCDQMETNASIGVEILSNEDSRRLFRQKTGDLVDSSSSHQEIALKVLNECKGLPIAIATVGLALRNKDEIVWHDALTQLRNSGYEDMEGMDVVISMVKLSFMFLQSESDRMCFLLCSLFPEDFRIKTDVLLTYMLGEKLLKNVDNMEQARQRLHTIVGKLTSSGLLLRSEEGDIMMHDVIRDVAIRIASDPEESYQFAVKTGLRLSGWPAIELEKCKRLSLMNNNIVFQNDKLPYNIVAPYLLTLSLCDNYNLETPSDFFVQMKNLRTLDLSSTHIRSLPSSIQCLEKLSTLRMDECLFLEYISEIEKLEMLEILTVREAGLYELPEGMCKLSNLKMLDASLENGNYGTTLEYSPILFSSMYSLEELYLGGRELSTLMFQDITSLTRLTRVDIWFPVKALTLNISNSWSSNLSKFKIAIGDLNGKIPIGEEGELNEVILIDFPSLARIPDWLMELLPRTNGLKLIESWYINTVAELSAPRRNVIGNNAQVTNEAKPLFSNLQVLELEDLGRFESLSYGDIPQGFLRNLRKLRVKECHKIHVLIPYDLLVNLQNVEEIKIDYNSGLKKIIQFQEPSMSTQSSRLSTFPPSSFLPNLTKLQVRECWGLKCIFPLEVAQGLSRLEWLEARDCYDLKMIFEDGGENASTENLSFPCLEVLRLIELPSFSSIGPLSLLVDLPALVDLKVFRCRELKTIAAISMTELKWLNVEQDWFDNLEWEDENVKSHLQSLIITTQEEEEEEEEEEESIEEDEEGEEEKIVYEEKGTEKDEGEFDYHEEREEEDGKELS